MTVLFPQVLFDARGVSVGAVVGMAVVGRVVGLVVEIVVAVGEETEKVMGHDVKLSLPGLSVLGLVAARCSLIE